MKHAVKLLVLPFCLMCVQNSYAKSVCETECVAADSGEVFEGIEYCHKQDSTHQVFILKVDLQADGIRPFVTPNLNGQKMVTSKFLSEYKVQTAINTAFFDIDNTQLARGYQKSNGVAYGMTDQSRYTMGFDQNNKYLQGQDDETRNLMFNATSGSHFVVKDGKKVDNGKSSFSVTTHPRTVVGIDESGRYFYMFVVDGRRTNRVGMSLSEISDCMLTLGAYQSINMDGGGSSTMVIEGKGVVNSPSDGSERKDPVHLGFYANPVFNNTSEDYLVQNTDVDGDGIADVCGRAKIGVHCVLSKNGNFASLNQIENRLTNDNGWTDVSNYATIRFADYNGDGLADLCARSNNAVTCWPSNGSGFGDASAAIDMSDTDGYNQIQYYSTIQFGDINGDGRDDMCARFKDGFRCYPSLESGWGEPVVINDMSDENGGAEKSHYATIRMGDINNDGRVDVCGRKNDGYYCWLSEGDKFREPFKAADWSNENAWNKASYYATVRLADINGDHKMDVCARDAGGIVCHLSNGESMADAIRGPELTDDKGWNDLDNNSTLRFGDFTGDGKDDLCIRANAGIWCYPSNGNGFDARIESSEMSNDNGWNLPDQYRTIRMGDINGDGKMEICGRNSERIVCLAYNGTGFDKIDGASMKNSSGWNKLYYFSTIRIGGPVAKPCSLQPEICDEVDNNCNGQIDEDDVCTPKCEPSEEICDGIDNDCDGDVDEDGGCEQEPDCEGADCEQEPDCEGADCEKEPDCEGADCEKEPDCEGADCDKDPGSDEHEEPGSDEHEEPDGGSAQSSQPVFAEEDCSCSIRRTPNIPVGSALAGLILFGAGLVMRRKREK